MLAPSRSGKGLTRHAQCRGRRAMPLPLVDPRLATLLRWRRDVRRFRAEPLSPGILDELVAAADLAPSVGLSQPWRLVLVDDAGRRACIRTMFEECNRDALAGQPDERATHYARLKLSGLDIAPCHLAVFVDEETAQGHGLGRRTMPETLAYSTVIAVHTLWLVARSLGVGVGWVSILNSGEMPAILDVPAAWRFVAYLCIGYPEGDSDTPELEREGWERRRPTQLIRR